MKYKITFLFIGLSVALHAQTINIDGTSYASISAAITASSNGDVIDITGTHTENLSWNNKNITIRGNDATTANLKKINKNKRTNQLGDSSTITRKDAIKKMGKYAALTAVGTLVILNPQKAQADSPPDPGGFPFD